MKEYGVDDFEKLPRAARVSIEQQLAITGNILKPNGHIITFTGELVARVVRVVVDGRKVDWFVQPLQALVVFEFEGNFRPLLPPSTPGREP